MKVSVIAPTSIPSIKANTLQVMKMTEAISSIGHQVHMVVPDSPDTEQEIERSWGFLANHYGIQSRFPITWLPARMELRRYDYAWNAVKWAEEWGADAIFTRLPQAAALGANRNLSTLFEIHDFPQGILGPIMLKLFLRGNGAQKLVVISRALANDMVRDKYLTSNSQKLAVLPDGVDLRRYEDLPAPEESREIINGEMDQHSRQIDTFFYPQQFTVGYTGHLYPGRGVSLILDIASQLPEINFLIIGGEPGDVNKLIQQVKYRELQNITLTGFIPNSELPVYQAACDVLLMPYQPRVSASSGGDIGRYLSPMKLFEYLASGRAICSSNLPVLKEVLTPETAVLLPPENVEAWVAAIQQLCRDPRLRNELAANAKAAAQEYSWQARAEKIFKDIKPS